MFVAKFFKQHQIVSVLSLLFFVSFGFSVLYVDIGFALKPYMISVVLIFLYLMSQFFKGKLAVRKVFIHEYLYILFLLLLAGSAVYSIYFLDSFRFTLNAALLILSYVTLRIFFVKYVSFDATKKAVYRAGFVVAASSLLYYVVGLVALDFSFLGNNIVTHGVMVDRDVPRLIGVVNKDPNIAAMFFSFFFLFTLPSRGWAITKIPLGLAIALTFSRGGYVALLAGLTIMGLAQGNKMGIKNIIKRSLQMIGVVGALVVVSQSLLGINIIDTVTGRFEDTATDGGSGRMDIWGYALETFEKYPILGIGANSTLEYNINNYNEYHYVHNTFLEVLSELGAVGASLYTLSVIAALFGCVYCARKGRVEVLAMYASLIVAMLFLSVTTNEVYMTTILVLTVTMMYLKEGKVSNDRRQHA